MVNGCPRRKVHERPSSPRSPRLRVKSLPHGYGLGVRQCTLVSGSYLLRPNVRDPARPRVSTQSNGQGHSQCQGTPGGSQPTTSCLGLPPALCSTWNFRGGRPLHPMMGLGHGLERGRAHSAEPTCPACPSCGFSPGNLTSSTEGRISTSPRCHGLEGQALRVRPCRLAWAES